MAQTLKYGGGIWANQEGSSLAYNDENGNYKPLPFSFERDSIATRVNKEGLIEVVGRDVPRIDYTDSAEGVLLLEKAATNSILQSNQFDTTWSSTNANITSGQIGVGGSLDAWKLESSGSSASFIFQGISTSAVTTRSIYAKAGSVNWFSINSSGSQVAYFDLSNGVVGTKSSNIIDATMESVGDGWYRCSVEIDSQSNFYVFIANADNSQASNSGDSIYIQYAQLETGNLSSYIPTSGSSVTRAAETANGSGNSEVFNDSEGVLFADTSTKADSTYKRITINSGSYHNSLVLDFHNSNNLIARIYVSGSQVAEITVIGLNIENINKICLKYTQNNLSLWVNGFEVGTTSISAYPTGLNELSFDLGSDQPFYGKTKEIGYYDTALTDEELEYMTSYRSLNEIVTELNLNTL
jgi:hypothetical protein